MIQLFLCWGLQKLSPGTQWVSKKGSLLAEKLCSEFVHLKQIIINF